MAEHIEPMLDDGSLDDAWLRSALHDAPVPTGLDARLKSAIKSKLAQMSQSSSASQAALQPSSPDILAEENHRHAELCQPSTVADQIITVLGNARDEDSTASPADPADRNWLRRAFIVLALAAGIGGFAFLSNRWARPAEPRWLAGQCDAILQRLEKDNLDGWQRIDQAGPKLPSAVTSQLTRIGFLSQQPLASLSPKLSGVVYRLDAGDGRGILLLRLERLPAVRGLTSRFEVLPTPSGGWSLAAMTVGGETYVLAGACTERQLFGYIRRLALT